MKKIITMACVVALGACNAAGKSGNTPKPTSGQRSLGSDEILSRLYELSPKKLNPQECGLFLWLKRSDTPLIYFQRASRNDLDAQAEIVVDGAPVQLERTEKSNLIALSYFEQQKFKAGDISLELRMKVDTSQNLRQGMKIPTATLALEDTKGWSAVLPVAGAIACQ